MMAMQLLRGRGAATSSAAAAAAASAESDELRGLRQQLAESQTVVLELQLEQVFTYSHNSALPATPHSSSASREDCPHADERTDSSTQHCFCFNFSKRVCRFILWQVARCSVTDLTVRLEQVHDNPPPPNPPSFCLPLTSANCSPVSQPSACPSA